MQRTSLLVALAIASASVACSSPSTGPSSVEGTGTVEAALSAVGSDGATYSIPTSASLNIQSGGTLDCETITSASTQTYALPAGSYSVYLTAGGCGAVPADAGANVPFVLTRTSNGVVTTVNALLIAPEQPLTVTAGSASSLVFQFTLTPLGTLTMSSGTVGVSIATDGGAVVSPTTGTLADSFTSSNWAPSTTPTTSLNTLLASSTSGSVSVGISHLSAFAPQLNDSACATFTPTISSTSLSSAYAALLQEVGAAGTTGFVCFFDQYSSLANQVQVAITRTGAPTTAAFQSALAGTAGATSTTFQLTFFGLTSGVINNGTSLALAPFVSPVTLTPTNQSVFVQPGTGPNYAGIAVLTGGLTATLVLGP